MKWSQDVKFQLTGSFIRNYSCILANQRAILMEIRENLKYNILDLHFDN
jgi:hypothetical protein